MPNACQHVFITAVTLGAIEIALQCRQRQRNPDQEFDWVGLLASVGAGVAAGAVPDWLEPSLGNPNHRVFFHSVTAAILVWWLVSGRHTNNLPPEARHVLSACAAGYSLHIGADLLLSAGKGIGIGNARF